MSFKVPGVRQGHSKTLVINITTTLVHKHEAPGRELGHLALVWVDGSSV